MTGPATTKLLVWNVILVVGTDSDPVPAYVIWYPYIVDSITAWRGLVSHLHVVRASCDQLSVYLEMQVSNR